MLSPSRRPSRYAYTGMPREWANPISNIVPESSSIRLAITALEAQMPFTSSSKQPAGPTSAMSLANRGLNIVLPWVSSTCSKRSIDATCSGLKNGPAT